jgi:cytochrome c peroxidase
VDPILNDFGRMRVTGNRADSLKFRVPSLRNLAFTENYFHDGRFSTPFHVFQHYRSGVQPGPTLDPLLQNGIPLTSSEEQALAAFLLTLADSSFLNNPSFRQ